MSKPASRLRHRLQLGAAIVASIGSVCIVSCVLNHVGRTKTVPHVVYVPAPPPLPPVLPKVIVAPIPGTSQIPQGRLSAALSAAIREGDLQAVEKAYSSEDSLDLAYRAAAAFGKRDIIKWFLDKGADVHFDELMITAPLLQADRHADAVQLIIERGASEPDLSTAIRAGAPNAVGRILAKDKDRKLIKDPEATYLSDAITSRSSTEIETTTAIIDKLLSAGVDVNSGDPLHATLSACSASDPSSVEPEPDCLLIAKKLLAKHPNITGDALGAAIDLEDSPGRTKLIDTLLAGKLTPDATAMAMAHVTPDKDAAIVRRLTARGIAWTHHDGEGDGPTPLVDAVEGQNVALVRLLLDSGAPADHHYKDGRSALGAAIESASSQTPDAERIVELLLQRGANVNRRLPDGRSPLFAAAESGDVRIVKAMLAAGARVNERILDETALDAAERSGNTPIARILDAHGGRRVAPTAQQEEEAVQVLRRGMQK